MSLDYNLSQIDQWETLVNEYGEPCKMTETIIWLTMTIGLERITKQNWHDFYTRVHIYEKVFGTFLRRDGKEKPIESSDIYRHIGLTTNSGNISYSAFLKRVYERAQREHEEQWKVAFA